MTDRMQHYCDLLESGPNNKLFMYCRYNMAVPLSNVRLRVPHGFQGLLEDITKEVLLMQPSDIYAFAAVYLEKLLQVREGWQSAFCVGACSKFS